MLYHHLYKFLKIQTIYKIRVEPNLCKIQVGYRLWSESCLSTFLFSFDLLNLFVSVSYCWFIKDQHFC